MTTLEQARALDAADPLRAYRERFHLPDGVIYLDGNSLGALPIATADRMANAVGHQWGERLIRSWNEADWIEAPHRIGAKIAPLIGVPAADVIVPGEPTSSCLYTLIVAAAAITDGPITAEADNFPTDAHVAEQAARLLGRPFRMVAGADMARTLAEGPALAIITHVNYRTGARADMAELNRAARTSGARIVWDLSHSTGAVPLALARDGAELAIGCGYKFLNGGPGAPAFLHVAANLQPRLRAPIAGWWGHAEPFAFGQDYRPAEGIARFLGGTPPMLSMLALDSGLDIFADVDMGAVWAKSTALFDLFAERAEALCPELELVSPRDASLRGSQIAFRYPDAYAIVQVLIERGVIGDFRAPDIARFGLTPLYLGFADLWRATETLGEIMRDGAWKDEQYAVRSRVT